GSFNCTCDAGYSLNIDGFNCDDNDECTLGTDNCHEFATCENTIGSFTCTCNEGYYGDGVTCTEYPLGVCQKPEEIVTLPYTHNSTTTGRDSSLTNYGLNCGSVEVSGHPSPDFVYSLELVAGDKVEITLTPVEGFDAVLAVIGTCGEDQDCVMYANENPAAQSEVLYIEAVSDATYFIVVEGAVESSYGSYTLDVKEWVEETDDDTVPDEDIIDEDIVDDDIVDDDIVDDDTVDEDSDILDDSDMSDDSDQSDESEPSDEDTGDTGDSGDTGDTGDTGNTGDTGDTGDTGNTGDTGDDADEISDEEEDADTETKDEEVYKLGGGGVGCAVVF
ncbi:MAG TPA: EGF domain-containing protein, partial [bacterium]|nr:EGF domain-containing protein [bacterium]